MKNLDHQNDMGVLAAKIISGTSVKRNWECGTFDLMTATNPSSGWVELSRDCDAWPQSRWTLYPYASGNNGAGQFSPPIGNIQIEFAKYFGAAIRILGVFSTADEKYENQLHAYAHQVKQYIKSKGIACTNKTLAGDNIAETVVEYANKIEADLIMIMTKTDLNMKEFFVGTTAQKVIDISNIPVLSIRPIYRPSINNGIIM